MGHRSFSNTVQDAKRYEIIEIETVLTEISVTNQMKISLSLKEICQ